MRAKSAPADYPSVAELARFGALAEAEAISRGDPHSLVRQVVLASDLDTVRKSAPGSAVVLHPQAAPGEWAVESALRVAWERNAACLVTPRAAVSTGAPARLAQRLRVWLFSTVSDPCADAIELAAQVALPTGARFRIAARCAFDIARQHSPRGILGALNAQLPDTEVAFVDLGGSVIAGRSGALAASDRITVPVPGPDNRRWAELVASVRPGASPTWRESIATVLALATAPLALCRARDRLATSARRVHEQALVDAIVGTHRAVARESDVPQGESESPTDPEAGNDPATGLAAALASAQELGWPTEGPVVGVCLRLERDSATWRELLLTRWAEYDATHPLILHNGVLISWWAGEAVSVAGTEREVRRMLRRIDLPVPVAGGIGDQAPGIASLAATLQQAGMAARAALMPPRQQTAQFADLGIRAILSLLPLAAIAKVAATSLPELVSAPERAVLVRTACAVLDAGGSLSVAARELGVHRNTVLGRLERLRQRGVDTSDPDSRLAMHVALHALDQRPPRNSRPERSW